MKQEEQKNPMKKCKNKALFNKEWFFVFFFLFLLHAVIFVVVYEAFFDLMHCNHCIETESIKNANGCRFLWILAFQALFLHTLVMPVAWRARYHKHIHTAHRFALQTTYRHEDMKEAMCICTGLVSNKHTPIWIIMMPDTAWNGLRYSETIEYHDKESTHTWLLDGKKIEINKQQQKQRRLRRQLLEIEANTKSRKQRVKQ